VSAATTWVSQAARLPLQLCPKAQYSRRQRGDCFPTALRSRRGDRSTFARLLCNFVVVMVDKRLAVRDKRGCGSNIGRVNRAICSWTQNLCLRHSSRSTYSNSNANTNSYAVTQREPCAHAESDTEVAPDSAVASDSSTATVDL
jgi:hypothetical protein